jgi:hypothetical protein
LGKDETMGANNVTKSAFNGCMKWIAGGMLVGAIALPVMAQTPPDQGQGQGQGQGGGGGGGGGGRGNFDPAQFRQRMLDNLKDRLGSSDEEWTALQPKVEKVMDAQRDAMAGNMRGMMGGGGGRGRMGGGGGGGGGGAANAQPPTPVQEKMQALRETLDNKDASADDIKTKLADLRDAKAKAKEDLTKAQDDLKSVLTQRQEATLVMMGMLE